MLLLEVYRYYYTFAELSSKGLHSESPTKGEVLEWLKRHAWKVCKRQKRFAGSNPALSAERKKPAVEVLLLQRVFACIRPVEIGSILGLILPDVAVSATETATQKGYLNRAASALVIACLMSSDSVSPQPSAVAVPTSSPVSADTNCRITSVVEPIPRATLRLPLSP